MSYRIICLAFLPLLLTLSAQAETVSLPGLSAPAIVVRDANGVPHIRARNRDDLYYLQGWVHAGDRLFQMDLTRRQPSGTLAELFGPGSLPGDVQARTLGLRRAAERTASVLSDATLRGLEAYARGVNDWVMLGPGLPPEYAALGFPDREDFRPWDIIDSIAIGKAIAFSLSFDLDTDLTLDFLEYLDALGPAAGIAVFTQDVFRTQPFDCASTVPDATGETPYIALPPSAPNPFACEPPVAAASASTIEPPVARAAQSRTAATRAAARLRQLATEATTNLRRSAFIRGVLEADGSQGSNEWAISRAFGANGRPLVANDPHLALNTPSTFYPVGLEAPALTVFGSSFPGVAGVVLGHNKHIHWGATVNPMDVTDTFVELLFFDVEGQPASTLFRGELEPVQLVPEQFFFNAGGVLQQALPPAVPAATIVVPRRNNGPIVALIGTPGPGAVLPALSVQYTGFSATREIEAFLAFNEARDLDDFRAGLEFFDFGSQNFIYSDIEGNIAYFTSAEMPLRADLQSNTVAPGALPGFFPPGVPVPPWLIRDGTTGLHEWLPLAEPPAGQAVPYEILPADEMPHTINPAAGWVINANNDPAGTSLDNDPLNQLRPGGDGLYYLNPGYAGGFRAGTITRRVRDGIATSGELDLDDIQSIQADVTLLDARWFVPWLIDAHAHATGAGAPAALAALGADAGVTEAIARLSAWDYSTPTGIKHGYDAGDPVVPHWSLLPEPDETEIRMSVAATIYSTWRGQAVRRIVDEPLAAAGLPNPGSTLAVTSMQHLLRSNGGTGIVDFFAVPGLTDFAERRDFKLLAALRDALDLLAGPAFAAAFAGSTDQHDYRWGKLHRIVFDHPFIDGASVPAQPPGAFEQPVPGLPGFPVDGGFNVVDASSHSARASSVNGFMFGSGPVRRYAAEPHAAFRSSAESIWAGGVSGVPFPGNPWYANLLPTWLVNEALPLQLRARAVTDATSTVYVPARWRANASVRQR